MFVFANCDEFQHLGKIGATGCVSPDPQKSIGAGFPKRNGVQQAQISRLGVVRFLFRFLLRLHGLTLEFHGYMIDSG